MNTTTTKGKTYPFSGHKQADWDRLVSLILAMRDGGSVTPPSGSMPTMDDVVAVAGDAKATKEIMDLILEWNQFNAQMVVHPSVKNMIQKAIDKVK